MWVRGAGAKAASAALGIAIGASAIFWPAIARAQEASGTVPSATGFYDYLTTNGYLSALGYVLVLAAVAGIFRRLMRTELWRRLMRSLTEDVLTNWQLVLLGATAILLSLASGYTTWNGMTNFTCPAREVDTCFAPKILSLLITFGVQGVMLITAWLIGESFATGMHRGQSPETVYRHRGSWAHAAFKALLVMSIVAGATLILALVLLNTGALKWAGVNLPLIKTANKELIDFAGGKSAYLGWSIASFLGVLALLYALSEREILGPYIRGLKIILRNLPLWIMFLACMAISVFFSFDSHFSTIFSPQERARAAELRSTNQVAGLVSDVGQLAYKRRSESIEVLFASPEWKTFEGKLDGIIDMARRAPGEIEALRTRELEAVRSKQASLQERKATAESQRVGLAQRKETLLGDVNRLKGEIPPLSAEVERLKAEVFKQESEILAKKAEADAEAGGVGGTLKAGRGPEFAKRKKELNDLGVKKKISTDQLKAREAQLAAARDAVTAAESQLAQIDGEIGKLKGESQLAEQQIAEATAEPGTEAAPASDVTKVFGSLETALTAFRREPERASFEGIQAQCNALVSAFQRVETLKAEQAEKGLGCDPGLAADRVNGVLARNDSIAAFKSLCGREDSLPQTGTDAVMAFGEKCIQTAGLPGEDTASFRDALNGIALNRDDKAHRFVVTINAFTDGNKLAYLALGIAFAVDALVFMAGLFGANAVRSPLSDVPHGKMRSASQLEAVIISALEPHRFYNARTVIGAMRPITPVDGFTQEVVLSDIDDDTAARVRTVLNAASTLNAVRRQDDSGIDVASGGRIYRERYLVRSELFEFLADVCQRELRSNDAAREAVAEEQMEAKRYRIESTSDSMRSDMQRQRAERLVPLLRAALLPELRDNLARLESAMRPVSYPEHRDRGFVTEAEPLSLPLGERAVVVSALNAGATKEAVEHASINRIVNGDRVSKDMYFVRPEFMAALTYIKLHLYERGQLAPASSPPPGPTGGGELQSIKQISNEPRRAITSQPAPTEDRDVLERGYLRKFAQMLEFDADDVIIVEQSLDEEVARFEHTIESGGQAAHNAQANADNLYNIIAEVAFELQQQTSGDIALQALEAVSERVRRLVPWLVNKRIWNMAGATSEGATRQ
ncbi:MAG: hypothetical protein U1E49_07560 [Hyphomicrobiaceae bacterium]